MKKIIHFLSYLAVFILLALLLKYLIDYWILEYDNPGYVLIGFGRWSLETSMVIFMLIQVISFIGFYVVLRFSGILLRFPTKLKSSGKKNRFNRSQNALIAGLVDFAEGNWEKAEKGLIKYASDSGAPLLHYLISARAAQSRGAIEKRDEYLKKAIEQSGTVDMAVGLTQTELYLSSNQLDLALATLIKLQAINPTHVCVLKLLYKTYKRLGSWKELHSLIPALQQNKILTETEVKLLEIETLSSLLQQVAKTGDAEEIQKLWESFSVHIQSVRGIANIYYATMIKMERGTKIEQSIVSSISKNWDDTLLVFYGKLEGINTTKQLETLEQWLQVKHDSAVLLEVLGKISLKCQRLKKAENYLTKSIKLKPTASAYRILGDVLSKKGDIKTANENYKKSLDFGLSVTVCKE